MPLVLNRIDERLIHGQVVLGWGSQLLPGRYIVVDDELAGSAWEQELYRLGAGDADVEFVGVDRARTLVPEWRDSPVRSILLTRDVPTMLRLARGGVLAGAAVNLGGIHHGPEREPVLTYVHLSGEERDALRALADEGVDIAARDVPDAHQVRLAALLGS